LDLAHKTLAIEGVLKSAGWLFIDKTNILAKQFFSSDHFWETLLPGIRVLSAIEYDGTKESTESAARTLLEQLHNSNIIANGAVIAGTNPPNLVVIEIGERPNLLGTKLDLIDEQMVESTNRTQMHDLMQKLFDLMN
jgi:hypothetical protein